MRDNWRERMKLWILNAFLPNTPQSYVLRAELEEHAREIAMEAAKDSPWPELWQSNVHSTCDELHAGEVAGVVLEVI